MARKPVGAIAIKWHKILSHTGSNTIEQLFKYVNGAELTELTTEWALLKIECKTCLVLKYTQ